MHHSNVKSIQSCSTVTLTMDNYCILVPLKLLWHATCMYFTNSLILKKNKKPESRLHNLGWQEVIQNVWKFWDGEGGRVPGVSSIASGGGGEGQSVPHNKKFAKKKEKGGKTVKRGKNGEKEEKSGRNGKNQKGSFILPLLIDRAGYTTAWGQSAKPIYDLSKGQAALAGRMDRQGRFKILGLL